MFRFKISSKNKRKSTKSASPSINTSNEAKTLHNIPSVSQIAPLPQIKSHGILPVLSLDGRDAPNPMPSDTLDNDSTTNITTSDDEHGRQPVGE